ncbi:MAG: sulfatase-like hydrolase/transferase [Phycisphaerae bacterium]|nr:sulfatase-like hydrolase/transferase [Phycisphaerae bacterium]
MSTSKHAIVSALVSATAILAGCRNDATPTSEHSDARRPNVLIITVDTLRADRLGCYGFGLARTKSIDRLAVEGVLCTDAASAAPITMPSHSTILTGLYPPAHGVRDNGAYALGDEAVTLAERLKAAGYETQAFVSALVLNRRYNLTQGFDGYDDDLWAEDQPKMFMIRDRSADKTATKFLEWYNARASKTTKSPFFAWIHFFDPHHPHEARVPKQFLIPTPYDAEISAASIGVGMVVDRLRESGELDNTIVVFTADHGESIGEHGEKTHAIFIYDATIRVPLIWRYPPVFPAARVYQGPVRTADIVPTILGILGLPGQEETQGVDLRDALRGASPPPDLPQYCESLLCEVGFGMAPLYGVRHNGFKYIRAPKPELYDLRTDPKELKNLFAAQPAVADRLDDELQAILDDCKKRAKQTKENPMDRETVEMLQALGYLTSDANRAAMGGIDPKDGIKLHNMLEDARHFMQRGRPAQAEPLLRELLRQTPRNTSARNTLAIALMRMNRLPEAEHEYLQSLADDPRQHRVMHMLGLLRLKQNDLDQAERYYKQALAVTPKFVESMVHLGFIALQRGRTDEAETWCKKALAEDPSYPRAYSQYGDMLVARKDYANAREYYRRCLQTMPRYFHALIQAGLCSLRLGEYPSATEYFDQADALRPDSWLPPYNLACIKSLTGDPHGAIALLDEAVIRGLRDEQLVRSDEDLKPLREMSGFQEIIERIRESGRRGDAPRAAAD